VEQCKNSTFAFKGAGKKPCVGFVLAWDLCAVFS
jgi:hypothetical protein